MGYSNYQTIDKAGALSGKRVLLRVDLNVPIVNGAVRDTFRIEKILPTLRLLTQSGAKIIVLAHLESEETESLRVVAEYINTLLAVTFVSSLEELAKKVSIMKNGEVFILENLRAIDAGEKQNNDDFAKKLAIFGDIYVNEAFSVSHRQHASIVGIPKYLKSFAGPLFDSEVRNLSQVFHPEHPFGFILGGAKFETKMPLVQKFLTGADFVFIGGALANDIYKERGLEVGVSVCSSVPIKLKEISENKKLIVPVDVVVDMPKSQPKLANMVLANEKIYDAGPKTIIELKEKIKSAKCILWNGPLGDYEKGFDEATRELAKVISQSSAHTIVGGGDTVAVLAKAGLLEKFSFVSTGGGAMLDFLAHETLPGIKALELSS